MAPPKKNNIWHTSNENKIIKLLGAKKRGKGADGVDQDGRPFEIRESKKTPKYRLQKDVHELLVKHNGYYIFKKGEDLLQVDAGDVTKMLKGGKWNKDRFYPYKFLRCKDLQFGGGLLEDLKPRQDLVEFYADFFTK